MILIEDTRNKIGYHKNIEIYCRAKNIEIVREKLSVGDYMLPGGRISVDTKRNVLEVCSNLMNEHARFWREIRRARDEGIKLWVVIEDSKIHSIQELPTWESKFTRVSGRDLQEEIYRVHISYGVEFVFCNRRETGKKIIEILTGGIS